MPAQRSPRTRHWLWPAMLLLGGSVMTLAWVVLALGNDRQASWMAVLTAIQLSWMLQLGTLPRGRLRIIVTLASVVAAYAMRQEGGFVTALVLGLGCGMLVDHSRYGTDPRHV